MNRYSSRAFTGPSDVEAMHALLVATWRHHGPGLSFHVGDLHWRLRPRQHYDPHHDIRLWFDATGALAGFAWLEPDQSGDVQCHPDTDRALLEPQLLGWLEETCRAEGGRSLTVGGFLDDDFGNALLESRGYRREDTYNQHVRLPKSSVPPAPLAAPGYTLRCTTEDDLSQQAITIANAFGTRVRALDTYRALREGTHYRNDLDWVAVAPDGQVAAFCIAWLDPTVGAGLLEPVGCHADHRRRGLARAVVVSAVRRLFESGAECAIVTPPIRNVEAHALYQAVGFKGFAEDYDWVLPLQEANSAAVTASATA